MQGVNLKNANPELEKISRKYTNTEAQGPMLCALCWFDCSAWMDTRARCFVFFLGLSSALSYYYSGEMFFFPDHPYLFIIWHACRHVCHMVRACHWIYRCCMGPAGRCQTFGYLQADNIQIADKVSCCRRCLPDTKHMDVPN